MDRTLWSIRTSRSVAFLKLHLCENKRKRSSVGIPSIISNFFVWARKRRRAMEKNLHVHRISAILGARRYLPQSARQKNWRCLIENHISRHVWLITYLWYTLNFRTHNSSSVLLELYHTIMYRCRTFWASRLISRFFNVCRDRVYMQS